MTSFHVENMRETGERLLALAGDEEFSAAVSTAADALISSLRSGGRIFSCGNGGSMCDAMHFAEELTGRFRLDRPALPAIAISDPSHLSCVSNDYGPEQVFSRYLEAHARPGDVLIALSTSGKSPNILTAAKTMKERGGHVVALTGRAGSPLAELAVADVCARAEGFADRAQEVHIVILHSLVQAVEAALFSA